MKIVINQATLFEPKSAFHNQVVAIQIADGIIEKIAKKIDAPLGYQVIEISNLCVSKGWFDSSVCLGEPGFEDCETISNGLDVAAKSGFTGIALQPNTFPVLDNQAQIQFVVQKAAQSATELYPVGALTKNSSSTDLAELFDMKNAGAIAFGDYKKAVSDANFLKIALQYAQDFDGLILAFCEDEKIKGKGVVNEGIVSTQLGLKGIPNLAEEIQVARNLFLLEYTGGKMHIPTISTAKSVELIQAAKSKGLQVTCSVAVHNLVLTDQKIKNFDSRFKVSPPLRTETNRLALINGVLNNTIDCITSDHNPVDMEHKKIEFDFAKNGTIGLESAFGALLTILPLAVVVEKLTAAKHIFGLPTSEIKVGNKANISLFTIDDDWIFGKKNIISKSKNSAFLNCPMKGKAVGIYNQSKLVLA